MPEICSTRLAGQNPRLVQAHGWTAALSALTEKKEGRTAIRCDRLIAAASLMKCYGGKRREQGGDGRVRSEIALDCLC